MINATFTAFWKWYEKNYVVNVGIAAFLFILQLFHLYWLTTHVVFHRIFGFSVWNPGELLQLALILVDYMEIPAIISVSFVYLHSLQRKFSTKDLMLFLFLNSQWLHIFWITDEFVVGQIAGETPIVLPIWLSWMAISIDYLELPVIYDTIRKFIKSFLGQKRHKLSRTRV